jgi:serine/threonine protein kinase
MQLLTCVHLICCCCCHLFADFGLAVFYDPAKLPLTDLGLEGTPWYMSPEVGELAALYCFLLCWLLQWLLQCVVCNVLARVLRCADCAALLVLLVCRTP